jgi:hypothetical protein
MNTRRLLALIALPVIVGTFGCVAQSKTTAQSPNRLAQNSSQPNQQQEGRRHRGPAFAAAAQKLGISEATLKEALGVPANPRSTPPTPGQRPPRPDFKAAAAKLGITEEQLINALGILPPVLLRMATNQTESVFPSNKLQPKRDAWRHNR